MATDQKSKVQKLEGELNLLQSERDNIVKALQHIRVLKEKSKIERLQVNSKLNELTTLMEEQEQQEKRALPKSKPVEPLPGPSRNPNISTLIGADLSFLDDPSVINQAQLNLDVIGEQQLVEEELETEEEYV